jgi:MoxR-like ATPase
MPITLQELVSAYLADETFQEEARGIARARNTSQTQLRDKVKKFTIPPGINLNEFLTQAEANLHSHVIWLAEGHRSLREIRRLTTSQASIEERLREFLLNLTTQNLGERIEQFASFLQQTQKKLPDEEKAKRNVIKPERAAFFLSLVACCLKSPGDKITIYYKDVLRGLRLLLDQGLVERTHGIHIAGETLVVLTQADHRATSQVLQTIIEAAPDLNRIDLGPYEPEFFLRWYVENEVWKEDETFIAQEIHGRTLDNQSLRRLTDDELTSKIAEVRQHVLVSEDTTRRIYEALLAGHVILTGPPGTGKTELARLLPEIFWSEQSAEGMTIRIGGYATRLVTASDGWSVHTLLGGLMPKSIDGQVHYSVRYGHLTDTIRKNWLAQLDRPHLWRSERVSVHETSQLNGQEKREFQGIWLVIDEFNRAPIDLALGEAMTTLSGGNGHTLHVLTDDGYRDLPLPRDFRILGTLNSFDRNYLNQISEALKRRFAFIDVPPPGRNQWHEEQAIVLRKTFTELEQFGLEVARDGNLIAWRYHTRNSPDQLVYRNDGTWSDEFRFMATMFEQAWNVFEVIRVYRRLGTAQAIALTKQMFIKALFRNIDEPLRAIAVDEALCDVIADQLQILTPHELKVLYWYIRGDSEANFIRQYNEELANLKLSSKRRLQEQLEVLSTVARENGVAWLEEREIERLLASNDPPEIARDVLHGIFHLNQGRPALPQLVRRLRAYRSERGL